MTTPTTRDHSVSSLVKAVVVHVDAVTAFACFTTEISAWWPLASHSVGEETAVSVAIAGEVGGQIVETYGDGETAVWGTVTEWDPPRSVAFTWHPGSDAEAATAVRVTFDVVEGGTEVTLTHSGWEAHPRGPEARDGYDTGWDFVLGRYQAQIG